jgi:hypothetical protein
MSKFETKPTILARILDGISKSISIRLENTIDAARPAWGLWMQPQYVPIRIREGAQRRATSYHHDRSSIR